MHIITALPILIVFSNTVSNNNEYRFMCFQKLFKKIEIKNTNFNKNTDLAVLCKKVYTYVITSKIYLIFYC